MNIEETIKVYKERLNISKELLKVREKEIVQELATASDLESALKNALDEIKQRKKNIETGEMIIETLEEVKRG